MNITSEIGKIMLFLIAALFLTACGADVGLGRPPGVTQAVPENARPNNVISTLPPLEMKQGECAIFLWAEESARPLVFTQNIATDQATVLINGQSIGVKRDQASEIVIPGFFARQSFSSREMSLNVRLKPGPARNLYEGIKIPSGILTTKNEDKSENIIAVSGLLGCNLDT